MKMRWFAGLIMICATFFIGSEVRAEDVPFGVYLESSLPFDGAASFTVGNGTSSETFHGYPRGFMYGFLFPVTEETAVDFAISETTIRDLNFSSRRYSPEEVRFTSFEIGGRQYPTGVGMALMYGMGEWRAVDQRTGEEETHNFETLGLKFGGNFTVTGDLFALINVRIFFDPSIGILSTGLGYLF